MSPDIKKLALFGMIISFLTAVYITFLGTWMKQGLLTGGFIYNWLLQIPRTYLAVLPFVLVVGPLVRKLVNKIIKE